VSDNTGIQWTDATWNPIRGCSRVSEGCRHCYAETVAKRFSGPGLPYEGLVNAQGRWNGTIRVVAEHLTDPLRWKRPRRVFVNSMSDLFHENVSDETIDRIFAVMSRAHLHTFQILTKRPERMRAYMAKLVADAAADYGRDYPFRIACAMPDAQADHSDGAFRKWPLDNVWLGVSVEDQATTDARIPLLLQTPAAVRFISAEPLLGPINLREMAHREDWHIDALDTPDPTSRLSWVIVGGESGHGARPCAQEWIARIVEQCQAAGAPVFVKQLGAYVVSEDRAFSYEAEMREVLGPDAKWPHQRWAWRAGLKDRKGGDMAEWPADLRVRELPR
jgi:protein gp37